MEIDNFISKQLGVIMKDYDDSVAAGVLPEDYLSKKQEDIREYLEWLSTDVNHDIGGIDDLFMP